jgi:hypothetical protein
MTLTAGVLSVTTQTSTTVTITSTAASGGTGPYTQQLYASTVSGFTPGAGNLISGATALVNTVTGLIPGTLYYFEMIYTDTGNSNATVDSTQVSQTTLAPVLNPNQFAQVPYLGQIDLRFPFNSVSVQIDVSQGATPLYAGSAVKMVNSPYGIPKVVGCTANTDSVLGFINFDIKNVSFAALQNAEISMAGNVIYLYSTGAIARGVQVTLDLSTNGGVATATGSNTIVGWAYDQFPTAGTLARVFLKTPSFLVN